MLEADHLVDKFFIAMKDGDIERAKELSVKLESQNKKARTQLVKTEVIEAEDIFIAGNFKFG